MHPNKTLSYDFIKTCTKVDKFEIQDLVGLTFFGHKRDESSIGALIDYPIIMEL